MPSIWANRNLRLLWAGQAVSALGDWIAQVAIMNKIYALSGGGPALGFILVAALVPHVLLAPLAGVWADRYARKAIMVVADLVRAAVMVLAVLVYREWHLYALAFLLGAGGAFFLPARSAAVPSIVPEQQVASANSLLVTTYNVALTVGPSLGGLAVSAWGTAFVFLADALSYLFSALMVYACRLPAPTPASARPTATGAAHDQVPAGLPQPTDRAFRHSPGGISPAISFVLSHRAAKAAVLSLFLVVATAGMLDVVEIVFAEQELRGGPAAYGFLVSAWGAGTVLGSVASPLILRYFQLMRAYPAAFLLNAVGLGVTAVSPSLPYALAAYCAGGFGSGLSNVLLNTLLMRATPEEVRGRVFALVGMVTTAAMGIAYLAGGYLMLAMAPRPMYLLGTAGCLLAWLLAKLLLCTHRSANLESC